MDPVLDLDKLNFVDLIVYRHLDWLDQKTNGNPVVKYLKTALKIIETIGLAISLIGIPLIIKARKISQVEQSNAMIGARSSRNVPRIFNETHLFGLGIREGIPLLQMKRRGLYPWEQVKIPPGATSMGEITSKCDDQHLVVRIGSTLYSSSHNTGFSELKELLHDDEMIDVLYMDSYVVVVRDDKHYQVKQVKFRKLGVDSRDVNWTTYAMPQSRDGTKERVSLERDEEDVYVKVITSEESKRVSVSKYNAVWENC